ncbi:MAG: thioredoxin domain-containing protein [Rhodothalassiaceae bacterium]|nr:MAG: thioredoxin domain-containing protein [Rhodothalassiaceae bacterium]
MEPRIPLTNRLAESRSPYLHAHADQPVAWQLWGEGTLDLARRLDRPVLLSSGYAACHWCHVMARESFSNPDIAARINAAFVPVKLDREEHPDIDHFYMTALQVMGVPGGWPMTVFLTPDGRPFAGGTYFPPVPRGGMPGLPTVLDHVARAWAERRAVVEETAQRIFDATARLLAAPAPSDPAPAADPSAPLARATERLLALVDPVHGGFGGAPKFPQAPALALLWRARRDPAHGAAARRAVRRALAAIVAGGIHDHVGGGFHRYTVDAAWQVPHFEKMLYDNAELLLLLADVARVEEAPWLADAAGALVAWLQREMAVAGGGFAAALDAETAGEEGGSYLWAREELAAVLGSDFDLFRRIFLVPEQGHVDGRIVIVRRHTPLDESWAREEADARRLLARLAAARAGRPRPTRDDKVIGAWNGRLVTALVAAGAAFARAEWTALAGGTLAALLARLRRPDGTLARHLLDGEPGPPAALEDYAALAEAALALATATGERNWFEEAARLADLAHDLFHDPASGLYRLGPAAGLPVAPVIPDDGPSPSGTALLLGVFSRLARLAPDGPWVARAEALAAALLPLASSRHPLGLAACLAALDAHRRGAHLKILAPGKSDDERLAAFRRLAAAAFPAGLASESGSGEKIRAILCLGSRCLAPAETPEVLAAQMEAEHV